MYIYLCIDNIDSARRNVCITVNILNKGLKSVNGEFHYYLSNKYTNVHMYGYYG